MSHLEYPVSLRNHLGHGVKSHHELKVWRTAIKLAKSVYELTRELPKEELYGLTSQMRRAATSIASNIAEGAARNGTKEFIQFLYIAVGSANELDTHVEISKEVGFMSLEKGSLLHGTLRKCLK